MFKGGMLPCVLFVSGGCLLGVGQRDPTAQPDHARASVQTRIPVSSAVESAHYVPAYAHDGGLMAPKDYREWIFLSSGIDMSYSPRAASANTADMDMQSHSTFDNVFVNPEAYRSFAEKGTWPDKTVMVLEVRGAESKGSINTSGHYQGTSMMGLEVHIKDEARFPGKWAFFEFDNTDARGTLVPRSAACYSCHAAHAAVDTTFVQFYPTLLPVARNRATLSAVYLKEIAASDSKEGTGRRQQ